MIIAGSYYCDKSVVDNCLAFVTCLKLKRKIYGVITEIIEEDGKIKYEYETWFENS